MSCAALSLAVAAEVSAALTPPVLGVAGDVEADLCCRLSLPFAAQVQLPSIALTAGILAGVNVALAVIDAAIDGAQMLCPFD